MNASGDHPFIGGSQNGPGGKTCLVTQVIDLNGKKLEPNTVATMSLSIADLRIDDFDDLVLRQGRSLQPVQHGPQCRPHGRLVG